MREEHKGRDKRPCREMESEHEVHAPARWAPKVRQARRKRSRADDHDHQHRVDRVEAPVEALGESARLCVSLSRRLLHGLSHGSRRIQQGKIGDAEVRSEREHQEQRDHVEREAPRRDRPGALPVAELGRQLPGVDHECPKRVRDAIPLPPGDSRDGTALAGILLSAIGAPGTVARGTAIGTTEYRLIRRRHWRTIVRPCAAAPDHRANGMRSCCQASCCRRCAILRNPSNAQTGGSEMMEPRTE